MSLVWSLLESNRYEDAETVARDASHRDSHSARLKSLLASVLIALERNGDALEAASEACALDPSSSEPHQVRAAALAELGRIREAY
jgi:Flp pilus assembly protein TadD